MSQKRKTFIGLENPSRPVWNADLIDNKQLLIRRDLGWVLSKAVFRFIADDNSRTLQPGKIGLGDRRKPGAKLQNNWPIKAGV